jgi:hypothetical protein
MFKIEKGIQVLPGNRGYSGILLYPWRNMTVGDSFFVPNINATKAASIMGSAYPKISSDLRPVRRQEGTGYRFWLVARDK